MRTALVIFGLLALTGASNGLLLDTLEKAKNWFSDLGNQLKDVGKALLDQTISQGKNLLSQSVQALGGAVISALPPNLAGKIIGRRSAGIFDVNADALNMHGAALKTILVSSLTDLERLNQNLYDDLQHVSLDEFNGAVDDVTDHHEAAVRSVLGDAVGAVTDIIRALLAKVNAAVSGIKDKVFGDEDVAKRDIAQLPDVEEMMMAAEQLFKKSEETIVQIVKEAGGALKNHAAGLVSAIKEKTTDIKEGLLSVENGIGSESKAVVAHAQSLLAELKTFASKLIQSTVAKLRDV